MSTSISIVVKALNEEHNIARCLESAVAAVREKGIKGEVILADNLSDDRTVTIAKGFPVRIVQLLSKDDRSCGVGPQLGYQYAKGDFIYILDGDMVIEKGFLPKAIEALKADPMLAGVAGKVKEMHAVNWVFERRQQNPVKRMGLTDRLEMGGLYRRQALEQVGYFSNRNLHAYEEADLGFKLLSKGWHLKRIDVPAIRHYGYNTTSSGVFRKRWRTKYVRGAGELLRASFGQPHFFKVAWHLKLYVFVIKWWLALVLLIAIRPLRLFVLKWYLLATAVFLLLFLLKKRHIKEVAHSLFSWHFTAVGLVWGLCAKVKNPKGAIPSRVIKK